MSSVACEFSLARSETNLLEYYIRKMPHICHHSALFTHNTTSDVTFDNFNKVICAVADGENDFKGELHRGLMTKQ